MTEDRLREIFNEGKPDWLSEVAKRLCSGEQVIKLLDTQRYFDLLDQPYPSTDGVLERFESEQLIAKNGEIWDITNLGAMVFGKRLDSFAGLLRRAPRVIVYKGTGNCTQRSTKPVVTGWR